MQDSSFGVVRNQRRVSFARQPLRRVDCLKGTAQTDEIFPAGLLSAESESTFKMS